MNNTEQPGFTVLKVVVGSVAHNMARDENHPLGPSDIDHRSIFVWPTNSLWDVKGGRHNPSIWSERATGDETGWEIQEYLNLVRHGEPNKLEMLWAPPAETPQAVGELLITYREALWGCCAVSQAFLNYGRNQVAKLLGTNGDDKGKPHVFENGYVLLTSRQRKFALQHLRTLYQGTMLLSDGYMPVKEIGTSEIAHILKRWRDDKPSLGEIVDKTIMWEENMAKAHTLIHGEHGEYAKRVDADVVQNILDYARKMYL